MLSFNPGDIVVALLKRLFSEELGELEIMRRPVLDVVIDGRPLLSLPLACPGLGENAHSDELSEFVAPVQWVQAVDRADAKWKPKAGLYITPSPEGILGRAI